MSGIQEYAGIKNSIYLSPELVEQLKRQVTFPTHNSLKSDIFSLGMCLLSLMSLGDMNVYDYQNGRIFWGRVEQKIIEIAEYYSMEIVELIKEMIRKNEDERPGLMKANIMIQEQIRTKKSYNQTVQNKVTEIKEKFYKPTQENILESPPEQNEQSLQTSQQESTVNNDILKYEEINQLLLKYGIPPISAHTITQDQSYDPIEQQQNEKINNFSVNEQIKDSNSEEINQQRVTRQLQFGKQSDYTLPLKIDGSEHSVNTNSTTAATNTIDALPEVLKQQIQKQMEESIKIQVQQQMEMFKQEYKKEMNKLIAETLPKQQNKVDIHQRIEVNNADSFSQKENFYQKCITFQNSNSKISTSQFSKPEIHSQNPYEQYTKQPLQMLELNNISTPLLSKYSSKNNNISSYKVLEFVQEDHLNGAYYEGQKLNGLRHGKGKYQYQDGGMYDGEWFENKMQGQGVLYYGSGKAAYDGEWVDDKFEGFGILHNEMPMQLNEVFDYNDMEKIDEYWIKYEGCFCDDTKEGMGTLYLTNGDKFYGQFKNDCIMGSGIYYQSSGQQIKGIWQNNQLVSIL